MPNLTCNLTAENWATDWIVTPSIGRLAATITARSGFTWSSAVVTLEYTLDKDNASAQTFSPTITWTTSTTSRYNIGLSGVGFIRWKVTTAESGNDPAAQLTYLLTR